jgi:ADP-heptose:LPS heptosyltransferase
MALIAQKTMHGIDVIDSAVAPSLETGVVADGRPVIMVVQRAEALGDAIVHIPAYRAIRCAFPSHRVVSVCRGRSVFSSGFAPLRPFFIDDLLESQGRKGKAHVASIARALGNVDVIFDLNGNLHALVNYLVTIGSARRYVANVSGFVLRRGVSGWPEARPAFNSHRYHRLVELAAGRTLPFDSQLPADPRAKLQIDALLPPGDRYLGIVPGRPRFQKYWPLDRHIALAERIRKMGIRPVYMLGPFPDEFEQREPLQQAIPEAIFIDQETAGGDANYLPWLFHAAAARLVGCVGIDGGICHMVATQDIPVAVLTGPMVARPWKPVTQQAWIVDARRFGSRKMDAISVDTVANVVTEMLTWSDRRKAEGLSLH